MLPWASRAMYTDNSDSYVLEGNRLRRNPVIAHFSAGASFSADEERRDKKAPSSTLRGASPSPATFSYVDDWWGWCRGGQVTFSCLTSIYARTLRDIPRRLTSVPEEKGLDASPLLSQKVPSRLRENSRACIRTSRREIFFSTFWCSESVRCFANPIDFALITERTN